MDSFQTTDRLRIYLNYGAIGFLATFILLEIFDETLMIIMPLIFNVMLWRKLGHNKRTLFIGIITWLTVTLIFMLQFEYRDQIEWGCIKTGLNDAYNLNYSSTMIFFSIIFWEIGFSVYHQRQPDLILGD